MQRSASGRKGSEFQAGKSPENQVSLPKSLGLATITTVILQNLKGRKWKNKQKMTLAHENREIPELNLLEKRS